MKLCDETRECLLPGTSIDDLVAELLVLEDLGEKDFLQQIEDGVSAYLSSVKERERDAKQRGGV